MQVYRIASQRYAADLSGTGAAIYGGRWNKPGTPVLYTGASPEIVLLENLVHLPSMLLPKLELLTIEIPNDSITVFNSDQLPANWFEYPAPSVLAEWSEEWIASAPTLALQVPSSIVHSAQLYVLNCRHPRYAEIKVMDMRPFYFDARLVSKPD